MHRDYSRRDWTPPIAMDRQLIKDMMTVLPKLGKDEVFILIGGARKKYSELLSTSHEVVIRKIVRENNPERFVNVVEKMYAYLLASRDMKTNKKFPPESLVIYINPIPRSMIVAHQNFITRMSKYHYQLIQGHDIDKQNSKQLKKMDVHMYSEIQNSPAKRSLSNCDIDTQDRRVFDDIVGYLKGYIKFMTKTRGGWHIVYRSEGNAIVYKKRLKEVYAETEWRKDTLTPVWGTIQGGVLVQPVTIVPYDAESPDSVEKVYNY